MKSLECFLRQYLRERPIFLSLIRAKEASLYQKYLPLAHPILDFGCGDGFFAKVVFGYYRKTLKTPVKWQDNGFHSSEGEGKVDSFDAGLDVKDSRIEEARKLGIYKKLVTYDGKKIPFADNYFSTIISNSVLEHVENLESVVKEIYRVLKPKGLFIATVMAKPWEENLFGVKLFGSFYKKWMRKKQAHVNLFNKKKWDYRFTDAGFRIKETIGHISPKACNWIDFMHYVSIPSLISYKILKRWILFPKVSESIYPTGYFAKIISPNVKPDESGAIFYVLRK